MTRPLCRAEAVFRDHPSPEISSDDVLGQSGISAPVPQEVFPDDEIRMAFQDTETSSAASGQDLRYLDPNERRVHQINSRIINLGQVMATLSTKYCDSCPFSAFCPVQSTMAESIQNAQLKKVENQTMVGESQVRHNARLLKSIVTNQLTCDQRENLGLSYCKQIESIVESKDKLFDVIYATNSNDRDELVKSWINELVKENLSEDELDIIFECLGGLALELAVFEAAQLIENTEITRSTVCEDVYEKTDFHINKWYGRDLDIRIDVKNSKNYQRLMAGMPIAKKLSGFGHTNTRRSHDRQQKLEIVTFYPEIPQDKATPSLRANHAVILINSEYDRPFKSFSQPKELLEIYAARLNKVVCEYEKLLDGRNRRNQTNSIRS